MTFKNDLSNLRSQIKSLNQKTNQYTTKCNDFQVELDHLFHMNEALQYKNRELVPMAATKRLDLNSKQKQMKEMQHGFVNMLSQQVSQNLMNRNKGKHQRSVEEEGLEGTVNLF